MLKTSVLVDLK